MKDFLLLEYEKLKDEQRARITTRENGLYTALIAIGGVFSALLTIPSLELGYLALNPILLVIGTSHYHNDEIIGRMNLYIQQDLGPRLAAARGVAEEEVFRWEASTRKANRLRSRVYQLVANLILYPGASGVALAFFALRRGALTQAEQLAILICALMSGLMLMQVLHHARR